MTIAELKEIIRLNQDAADMGHLQAQGQVIEAQAEIERQRQQVLSGLQVSYDDPGYLAGVVFGRLVYGLPPYL